MWLIWFNSKVCNLNNSKGIIMSCLICWTLNFHVGFPFYHSKVICLFLNALICSLDHGIEWCPFKRLHLLYNAFNLLSIHWSMTNRRNSEWMKCEIIFILHPHFHPLGVQTNEKPRRRREDVQVQHPPAKRWGGLWSGRWTSSPNEISSDNVAIQFSLSMKMST